MRPITRIAPLIVLLLAVALPASAQDGARQQPAAPQPAAPDLDIPFERYELENGLEVILHEDHRLPLVAVNLWYHVGGFHEPQGRTGFAHLFEHMMFQGSAHVDNPLKLLQELGATTLNGTTSFDRTNYFETVPAHHLETALWLESDRMGFLLQAMTEEKLATQVKVVKNERRQSYETRPYGLADEKMWHALFPAPHPYHGMVIGSMADLEAASLQDVRDFFTTWYAPSNATLVLAGDFDPERAKALVQQYFGPLASRPDPKAPEVEPVRFEEEVVIRHEEPVASLPKIFVGWHSPPAFAEGDNVADILMNVLSAGRASRLQRRLVHELQIAQSVQAYQYSLQAQSVFGVEAVARPGVTTEQLLKEIDAVLDEVRAGGVTDDEVRRALNRFETHKVAGLQSLGGFGGKADQLQYYNHYLGDPDYIAQDLARYRRVTAADVTRFATTQLAQGRRVVLHAVPPAEKQEAPEGQPPEPPDTEPAEPAPESAPAARAAAKEAN